MVIVLSLYIKNYPRALEWSTRDRTTFKNLPSNKNLQGPTKLLQKIFSSDLEHKCGFDYILKVNTDHLRMFTLTHYNYY